MERVKWSDQRRIAAFVRELYCLGNIKAISERVVETLSHLIDGNSSIVVNNDSKLKGAQILAENVGPDYQKLLPAIWALRHEHPGIKHLRVYATQTVTLSDLLPYYQWKKTALFNEIYSHVGMQEQLAGAFPFACPDLAGVLINRSRCTFTQRDRTVLNILRFHISEACKTARMHAAISTPELADAIESLVGGTIIVLNAAGIVQFCSDLAQNCLETFFPAEKPFKGGLPLTVAKWAHREIAAFGSNELAVRLPEPLTALRGDRCLHIRLASASNRTMHFLVLRSEDPTLQLKKLSSLGLGPRATQVLYWLAKGKTNGEIAIILGARPRTIEKHVEGILAKLGVENRVTAALVATDGRL
jgi:DNA-binding CsgD family transcriptional regulator